MFLYACCVFIYSLCCIQNLVELKAEGMCYFLEPTVFKKLHIFVSANKNLKVYCLPEL